MRSQLVSLLAFISSAVAAGTWAGMENLPDGVYVGAHNEDGSTTMTRDETGETYTFPLVRDTTETRDESHLEKRFSECWGYQLDQAGTDEAVVALKKRVTGFAGAPVPIIGLPNAKPIITAISRGVKVYWCAERRGYRGDLNVADVNHALRSMDGHCKAYEASYYRWDGTPEILGKTLTNVQVCVGNS